MKKYSSAFAKNGGFYAERFSYLLWWYEALLACEMGREGAWNSFCNLGPFMRWDISEWEKLPFSTCLLFIRNRLVCQEHPEIPGVSGFGMSADFFLFWDPVRVHDRQFSQDLTPVPDRHRPFSGGFERGQVQSLQKCLSAWKYGPLTECSTPPAEVLCITGKVALKSRAVCSHRPAYTVPWCQKIWPRKVDDQRTGQAILPDHRRDWKMRIR